MPEVEMLSAPKLKRGRRFDWLYEQMVKTGRLESVLAKILDPSNESRALRLAGLLPEVFRIRNPKWTIESAQTLGSTRAYHAKRYPSLVGQCGYYPD